jgi:E3 ubiquitin-protein ligase Topors
VSNPTPRQISEDAILTQRATSFLRRELRVWSLVDVEILTVHILNLIKAIDIRSEPAVRLLGELLDTDEYPRGAEHFAHELYSWLRSPYKDLRRYDEIAQVGRISVV